MLKMIESKVKSKLTEQHLIDSWTRMAETFDNMTNHVKIDMVGKYISLTYSYLSVVKALLHACISCSLKPHIEWIAASNLKDESEKSVYIISDFHLLESFCVIN
ncbi:hypothetical protein ISN45_Aa04g028310 [Arabidopsis thaliana x Arabidopsis arenosa]|uniref:Uncharacterized protein n=1 Tax=Arabidopsis thaliana x Arabidopsis arenosa TaxID=1240361 RepID=A0A8T2AF75_9BRAS|nr:hypothetical protein ISN45_Aa04g028310 [Arabidopsis thaliana x Arabidopsis arenosa]